MKYLVILFSLLSTQVVFGYGFRPIKYTCQSAVEVSETPGLLHPQEPLNSVLTIVATSRLAEKNADGAVVTYRDLDVINEFGNEMRKIDPNIAAVVGSKVISFNDAYQVQAVSHFTILPNDREKKEYLPALTQSIDLNQNTDCESHCFDGATNIIQIQQDLSSLGDDGVAKRVLIRQEYNNKDGVSIVFRGECARTL